VSLLMASSKAGHGGDYNKDIIYLIPSNVSEGTLRCFRKGTAILYV